MSEEARYKLLQCIMSTDRELAQEVLLNYARSNSYEDAISDLLEPSLKLMGDYWQAGQYEGSKISLAHGYMAGKIAEDFLSHKDEFYSTDVRKLSTKGKIILGNIEDDYHSLGRRMLSTFLKTSNFEIVDLGNDVTAETFLEVAIEESAQIIGVSAMMYSSALNIKKLRKLMDHEGYTGKIMLAVGGAIFNIRPELVDEVGGDGTSPSGIDAPKLMEDLIKRSHL